ncbi:minor tail protein [Mycobacterium phage Lukilu]|uniref:Uncharacterized protein n=1 Tax=Mycobacterium phage Lukilu TaxID=1913044 RepID=A0A1J0M9U9_9CAUD|nr:minor tail protein [Mycobacterium phage Lukilu]APD17145.1 hypothetical protein SEA_LUKILU_107 [Mycobacterium phage Lukilu]
MSLPPLRRMPLWWPSSPLAAAVPPVASTRPPSGGDPMRRIGSVRASTGSLTAFVREKVAGGSLTVTPSRWGGSGWARCWALSYTGVEGVGRMVTNTGTGNAPSLGPIVVPPGGMLPIGFSAGDGSTNWSAFTGGNVRLTTNDSFNTGMYGDSAADTTFGATMSNSRAWMGLTVPLLTTLRTGPRANYDTGMVEASLGGVKTTSVYADVGDYVILTFGQDGGSAPTPVTCEGVAMTELDVQTIPGLPGGTGFIRRYISHKITTAGAKAISATQVSARWGKMHAMSISGVSEVAWSHKAASSGGNSAPTHVVPAIGANQFVVQTFFTSGSGFEINTGADGYAEVSNTNSGMTTNLVHEGGQVRQNGNQTGWGSMATAFTGAPQSQGNFFPLIAA